MFVQDVVVRVAEMERLGRHDPEAARCDETELHRKVLEAIADGHPKSAALAREALKTFALDFPRW
jgi:hypothetical protein